MSGRARAVLMVVTVVALIGGLALFAQWRRETRLESGQGELHGSFLVQGEPLSFMSIESLYFSSEDDDETIFRATTWNAKTGQRLARVKEVAWRTCTPAGTGLVWCHTEKEQLEVVNVPSLTVKHSAADVSAKVGQKMMNASQLEPGGKMRITLADGRKIELDAETLNTTPQTPAERQSPPGLRLYPCSIPNSARQGLCDRNDTGGERRLDTGDGWLRPTVLLEVPGGWILGVNTSLDDSANERRIVRVDEQFKDLGATNLGKMANYTSVTLEWVTPGELFLVSSRQANLTFGIQAKTGQEVFRIQH